MVLAPVTKTTTKAGLQTERWKAMDKFHMPLVTRFVCSNGTKEKRRGEQESWVFIWDDIDRLFNYLLDLSQDPCDSNFGLVDLKRVMAMARWQLRQRERHLDLYTRPYCSALYSEGRNR
jgi:hypothetical protein